MGPDMKDGGRGCVDMMSNIWFKPEFNQLSRCSHTHTHTHTHTSLPLGGQSHLLVTLPTHLTILETPVSSISFAFKCEALIWATRSRHPSFSNVHLPASPATPIILPLEVLTEGAECPVLCGSFPPAICFQMAVHSCPSELPVHLHPLHTHTCPFPALQ